MGTSPLQREDRLVAAAEAALNRLKQRQRDDAEPDIFAELGETLFWIAALAELKGQQKTRLILGLQWARNRITHGVLVAAPATRIRGGELPAPLPFVPGVRTHYTWLQRSAVTLGPDDQPRPDQESEYDREVAGKVVDDTLDAALALLI
jgi:hypothetical protein